MASKSHQMIIGLIARKMREKGYEVVGFDGDEAIVSDVSLKIPPTIGRHKPDLIGVNLRNKRICIGEAKTPGDLDSKRTREQFKDFADLIKNFKDQYELIIGIQKSSERKLKEVLMSLRIENNKNMSYIWIPEELLPNEEREF